MSFQLSPETLIIDLDRQILDSNDKIDEALDKLLVLGERPEQIIEQQEKCESRQFEFGQFRTVCRFVSVLINRNEINAWNAENNRLNNIINTEQIKITELEEQKRILQIEAGVRAEQFAPFFENLIIQLQNLLTPQPEVTPIEIGDEMPAIEKDNTLRNVVIVSLVAIGGVLVFR